MEAAAVGASVVEVWLLDLVAGTISVFEDPGPDGCRTSATAHCGDSLRPSALPGPVVAAADLLG